MNRVNLGIKDLATGMRVDLDSMDEIHDVLIILGDIDDDTNSGVIKYIGTSDEEAAKAWEDLQTFLYEYGAATVLGHYTGVTAMNEGVEGVNYLRFNTYWGASVSK